MARFNFTGEPPIEEKDAICSLTVTNNIMSGRWKVMILWHLSLRTIRFNELQRLLPGISKGILTTQLRELEDDGLVHREIYKEIPPKVEYSLTPLGKSFIPILTLMGEWGKEYIENKSNSAPTSD